MFSEKIMIFFTFLMLPFLAIAQKVESDSASFLPDLKGKLTEVDTLKSGVSIDSIQSQTAKIDSIHQTLSSKLDSLQNPHIKIQSLDSARHATQAKIDSLEALKLPYEKYVNKLDSLNQIPANAINKQINTVEQKVEEKIETAKTKINEKLNGEENLGDLSEKISEDKLPEIPGQELPDGMPGADITTEGVIPDIGENLDPGLSDKLDIENVVDIDNPTGKIDELKKAPNDKIKEIKSKGEIEELSHGMDKAGEIGDEISGVNEDLSKARAGDMEGVEQRIEDESMRIDEIGEVKKQTAEFDKWQKEQEAYRTQIEDQKNEVTQYSDPNFVKQRLLEKSQHVAKTDVLEQYKAEILAAREELATIKIPKLDSVKHLKIKKPHKLSESPLRERIRPGFLLEINRINTITAFDFTPMVGYLINDKLTVYGAYMYRFNFNNDTHSFVFQDHTYGLRILATYNFYKGFFAKVTLDQLRTDVIEPSKVDIVSREWVKGAYVGLGNAYAFSRRVKGNIQIMYNLTYDDTTPYPKKYNIRFGFEFDLTKEKKTKFKIPGKKSFKTPESEGDFSP